MSYRNLTDTERARVMELYYTQTLMEERPVDLNAIAFEVGRTAKSVAIVLRKAGIKVKIEYARIEPETGYEHRHWCIEGDQAFTAAMFRAIDDGMEHPPKIGMIRNHEGLAGLRRYYAEPQFSVSSPAGDLADLGSVYG